MKKFDQKVGSRIKTKTGKKNQKLKRPKLTIYPIEANPSFSEISVESLNIDSRVKMGLGEMGITKLSKVQALMLDRFYTHDGDIMAISETGSGKTLAYLLIALGKFYIPTVKCHLETSFHRSVFISAKKTDLKHPFIYST